MCQVKHVVPTFKVTQVWKCKEVIQEGGLGGEASSSGVIEKGLVADVVPRLVVDEAGLLSIEGRVGDANVMLDSAHAVAGYFEEMISEVSADPANYVVSSDVAQERMKAVEDVDSDFPTLQASIH
ncbi:hypothetical protein V6N12_035754 [Hibiscus sabdariffa]|uniref:Uncharacterized protein n=1 Tax=Hibiscus sabdariffa TaxID=183260 RepID=A0ABR2ENM7_9ROSI